MLEFNTEGKCFSPRAALGGVANIPIRVKKAEETLKGKKLKISDITTAMQAANELNPIPSIHGSPWYKKEISKILIRDSIQLSAKRAGIEIEE
jgi:CO/xanthine dehydrogenase FAD-binding subunit